MMGMPGSNARVSSTRTLLLVVVSAGVRRHTQRKKKIV
jgi:hypothetical protein